MEANPMVQKLDEILNEMSAEVNGYIASALVGMDGLNIAQHTKNPKVNLESVSAQSAMHTKLAFSTMERIGMGHIEDNLIQTRDEFLFTILLPNDDQHFLCVVVDRKNGSLGNLRLISKIYADRISKAMPR
jgi:predicted regulator of Ras-like GTPase activity (Roadblock/LC7/MglB family)